MNVLLVFLSSVALLLGADSAKQDLDQLQGAWTVSEAVRDGNKAPEEVLKKMEVIIKDDTISITEDKDAPKPRSEKAVIELNPSTKPKSVDIKPDHGNDKPVLGIYELDGDTLKICFDKHSEKRPTSFDSKPDSGSALLVLKRAKKE
jgi:uncharacterized protein (TIGR03067 family)